MKKGILKQLMVLGTLLLTACSTEVDLCYDHHPDPDDMDNHHPHQARVDFNYNWGSHTPVPDSMKVLALRPVNQLKYLFKTTSKATGNTGQVLLPTDEAYFVKGAPNDQFMLRNGSYQITAFNGNNDIVELNTEEYETVHDSYMDDIVISYPVVENLSDFDADYTMMRDRNPYSAYLNNADVMPIYLAYAKVEVPRTATEAMNIPITLTPNPVTQAVTIIFEMETEPGGGVVIDDVQCIMSGTGRSVQIGSEVVNIEKTYKVPYRPRITRSAGHATATGTIHVPGIVRNETSTATTGPGILQVNVNCHYTDDHGLVHRPTLGAIINLYRTLGETPSLVPDEDERPVQSAHAITLRIGNIMRVTRSRIESSVETGLDGWIDVTPAIEVEY